MPWQCRLVDIPADDIGLPRSPHSPGTMYYGEPCMLDPSDPYGRFCLKTLLSNEYKRDWMATRRPLFVVLPNGEEFCVDFAQSQHRGQSGQGWTVTGTPPAITVSPSINCEGRFHGWLTGGVLSDDCEGRRFP